MTTRTLFLAVAALSMSTAALAADVKTYQVTGPVLDMTADSITVQKGKDKWEIAKGADTKMMGDVKTALSVDLADLSQRWGIMEASRRISAVRSASSARTRAMRDRPSPPIIRVETQRAASPSPSP